MMNSGINWCHHTFNSWIGCTKVSPGCKYCYAASMDARNLQDDISHWGPGAPRKLLSDGYWKEPLKWNKDAAESGRRVRVFCSSLADVFDPEGPTDQRERLWKLIKATPHLDWLLLTKRPENVAGMLPEDWQDGYHNVWLGVSVEDRKYGLPRIDILRTIPAIVRFLSCEPLLEDLGEMNLEGIDWCILGGETGRGARSFDTFWAASIIGQCRSQNVYPWVKQLGRLPADSGSDLVVIGDNGKRSGNGEDWSQWPECLSGLRVRELPVVDPDRIASGISEAEMSSINTALEQLANGLSQGQSTIEINLRSQFFNVERSIFITRQEKGKVLAGFKALYSPSRKWTEFCRIVNIPRQTAYDLLAAVDEAEAPGDTGKRTESVQSPTGKAQRAPIEYDFDSIVNRAENSLNRILRPLTEGQRADAMEAIWDRLTAREGIRLVS
jgi:protein gp37